MTQLASTPAYASPIEKALETVRVLLVNPIATNWPKRTEELERIYGKNFTHVEYKDDMLNPGDIVNVAIAKSCSVIEYNGLDIDVLSQLALLCPQWELGLVRPVFTTAIDWSQDRITRCFDHYAQVQRVQIEQIRL